MDIRKIILSYRLYGLDKKTHVKNWIKDVSTCYDKADFINLLENWNHHEPERTVEYILTPGATKSKLGPVQLKSALMLFSSTAPIEIHSVYAAG